MRNKSIICSLNEVENLFSAGAALDHGLTEHVNRQFIKLRNEQNRVFQKIMETIVI